MFNVAIMVKDEVASRLCLLKVQLKFESGRWSESETREVDLITRHNLRS